jgi:prepilin-type N-terminal cleavage/methylation domain-containing protein
MAQRRGFTLFELTAVLVLAAMLVAVAAPHFAAMRDGAAVRAALGDIGGTLDLARQSAVANRVSTSVVIDTASGELVVRRNSPGGAMIARRTIHRSYGVTLGANRDSVVYDSRGLGYGVSNVTVTARRGRFVDTLSMSRLGRLRY